MFGFVLGGIFDAFPLTAGVLTFEIGGTLMICAIEGAVIAGGIGVLMAALNGHGVLRDETIGLTMSDRTVSSLQHTQPRSSVLDSWENEGGALAPKAIADTAIKQASE